MIGRTGFFVIADGVPEVRKRTREVFRMGASQIKIAFGTDALMAPEMAAKQGKLLCKLTRWFTPYEALKMGTSDNAELMDLAGPRQSYRDGPLGEITVSAYAGLILVDGNPLEDLSLVTGPENNLDLIMKDGKIYKNTLK